MRALRRKRLVECNQHAADRVCRCQHPCIRPDLRRSRSTNGFLAADLVVGTYTLTNPAGYPFAGAFQSNYVPGGSDLGGQVRPSTQLATCPATLRLFGTGSANHAGFSEVADGNVTDTVTVFLVVARNGANL